MLRILPRTNSTQSANSELESIKSPRSLAKIEELEAPEDMVEQHSWNRFHEIEHEVGIWARVPKICLLSLIFFSV
jgi:hypothetical protein